MQCILNYTFITIQIHAYKFQTYHCLYNIAKIDNTKVTNGQWDFSSKNFPNFYLNIYSWNCSQQFNDSRKLHKKMAALSIEPLVYLYKCNLYQVYYYSWAGECWIFFVCLQKITAGLSIRNRLYYYYTHSPLFSSILSYFKFANP